MARQKNTQSIKSQAEEHYREEALEIARKTQMPGQTREQTKLIAKGIAKGIAQYKKQEKAKIRERDRNRKKAEKNRRQGQTAEITTEAVCGQAQGERSARIGLAVSSLFFLLAGALHLLRLVGQVPLRIGQTAVPEWVSLAAAAVLLLVGGWLWILQRRLNSGPT